MKNLKFSNSLIEYTIFYEPSPILHSKDSCMIHRVDIKFDYGGIVKVPNEIFGLKVHVFGAECFNNMKFHLDLSKCKYIKALPSFFCNNCTLLSLILPENLEIFSNNCFKETKICGNVIIPKTVTAFGDRAFLNTEAKISFPEDTSIVFKDQSCAGTNIDSLIVWSKWELNYCSFSDSLISELIIKDGVKDIPSNCFARNRIQKLTLPESIENIYESAFFNNFIKALNVNWKNVKFLGESAFKANLLPSELDLSDLLIPIPHGCFFYNHIKKVKIGDFVTLVSVNAFDDNVDCEYGIYTVF